jgi:putative protease
MEALRAAVQNGADAVYLGFGSFNARRGARNFTAEELQEAVIYCHIRGVKVHLTLNTLVSDREMTEAAACIRTAARCGVDAFIVQDLGLATLCRQVAPDVALHASTQMSIHSLDGVLAAAALGAERVVLARELSSRDIAYITRNSPVEIEVFGHGALCMSYSGQCYLSAVIGRRSGNRGQCAQPCRLPYGYDRFAKKYPLSLKDNCLVQSLRQLQDMGVASLKLEGRMKRPEYVAIVTRIYRAALDGRAPGPKELAELETAFSREGFTRGYFDGQTGPQMFGTRIPADEEKTQALYADARATYDAGEAQRVPVRFYAAVEPGAPVQVAVEDDRGNVCRAVGPTPQAAVSRAMTQEELSLRLGKTGGTPYYAADFRLTVAPGLALSASAINALRRDVLQQLSAVRGRIETPRLGTPRGVPKVAGQRQAPALTISIHRAEQLTNAVAKARPAVLYVPLDVIAAAPEKIALMAQRTEVCAIVPRVIPDSDLSQVNARLQQAAQLGVRSVLSGNLGHNSLLAAHGFAVRGDFGLNVFNSRSLQVLRAQGLQSATASFELTLPQIRDLSRLVPTELLVYGRLPLMLTENCIIHGRAAACTCGSSVKLVDRKGAEFPILRDCGTCRSELQNGKKLYLLDKRKDLNKLGLWALRLRFTTENPSQVAAILAEWASGDGQFEPGMYTRGLYTRGVE